MVGQSKKAIVGVAVVQNLLLIGPAILLAVLSSIAVLSYANVYLEEQFNVKIDSVPSSLQISQVTLIGIFIPILSSIMPVRRSLE